jgi:TonB family protein
LEAERKRQADELARQKEAEELARRRQAEELAAKAREQDLARQRAEAAAAAAERERIAEETGRAAAAAAAASQAGNDSRPGNGPSSLRDPLGGSGLVSRALEQARRPDLLAPQRPAGSEPDRSARRSVFGSLDRDVGLSMYIKSWSVKIERNGSLNYSQLSKDRARGDPVVTVAIRSDGSVEDIIINRSSGRPDLDEAVRRIVRLNARYAVFPPDLARKYDVIEIRRIWSFDDSLRLVEEVR